jgi:cobalt-zinc-cadmium efflux system outer membrane protein
VRARAIREHPLKPRGSAVMVVVFVFAASFAAREARAEEPPPPLLRLSDALEEALRANPRLQAARERASAARAEPARVSSYDDPVVSWEAWNTPESFRIDQADNNIFKLSQKIPFPGKRSLAGRMAERDADVASDDASAAERDLAAMVKRAYYALWQSHENLAIYSRDEALVERFAKIAEQKYALGQVSQPDVLRSQVELTRLLNRVTTETLAIDGARAELNALLGRSPSDSLGVPEAPPPLKLERTDEELTALALKSRPEVSAKAALVERERAKLSMAKLDYLPDFELSVSRFVNYQSRDGFGAMAAVSLPFVNKRRYDAEVDGARAAVASAEAEYREITIRVTREVRQAFLRARAAFLQRDLLVHTHVPLAEQTLGASEIAYQTGKLDFLSLIDSLRAVESVHLEHAAADAEFAKALADLELAVGEPIAGGDAR